LQNKQRSLVVLLSVLAPCLMMALPGKIKADAVFNFNEIPFFVGNFVFILLAPFVYRRAIKQIDRDVFHLFVLGVSLTVISSMTADDYILQRIIISSGFFFVGMYFYGLKIEGKNLVLVKWIIFLSYLWLTLQVITTATGFYQIDTGIQQEFSHFIRRGTTAGPATQTAHLILIMTGILLVGAKQDMKAYALLLLSTVTIFFTGTKGALLPIIFIDFYMLKETIRTRRQLFLSTLLVVILVYLFFSLSVFDYFNARVSEAGGYDSGRSERIADTFNAYNQNIKSILIGYGGAITPYYDFTLSKIKPEFSPHNFYLTFLIENGLLGLISIFSLLAVLVKKNFRTFKTGSLSVCIFFTVLLFTFNTELIGRTEPFVMFFWLYFVLIVQNERKIRSSVSHQVMLCSS